MSARSLYSGPQTDRNGAACIWLQSVGLHHAKPAAELQVGDTMVWNFGSTSTVLSVRRAGASVYVKQKTDDGKEWPEVRYLGKRLIAWRAA